MAFINTWNALQVKLTAWTHIPFWTGASGYQSYHFTVVSINCSRVVVASTNGQLRMIRRNEFYRIYNYWRGYINGWTTRNTLKKLTRSLKYIISIFRWLQTCLNGHIP